MNLSITNRTTPARDLGLLLHKHPDRMHETELGAGMARVFYPVADDAICTALLTVDVDPIRLVRGTAASSGGGSVAAYVNDRPYAVSSFMSVAIARVLGSALGGRCKTPDLAEMSRDLEIVLSPINTTSLATVHRLFAPLGYEFSLEPLDSAPDSRKLRKLTLRKTTTLALFLTHLYILIPVLDGAKHYWVDEAELAKLLQRGGDWLAAHPDREYIVRQYLRRAPGLAKQANAEIASAVAQAAQTDEPDAADDAGTSVNDNESSPLTTRAAAFSESALERPLRLQDVRMQTVAAALKTVHAKSVLDLGCGEGDLLEAIARNSQFEKILGVDVSVRELQWAQARIDRLLMPISRRNAVQILQSSLLYRDERLRGFDAITIIEVIEHLELERVAALEDTVFTYLRPRVVLLSTPNAEYNALFPSLPAGKFRHTDHRFEWTRAQFEEWAQSVAARHSYMVRFETIGNVDAHYGAPTQMAVFECA